MIPIWILDAEARANTDRHTRCIHCGSELTFDDINAFGVCNICVDVAKTRVVKEEGHPPERCRRNKRIAYVG